MIPRLNVKLDGGVRGNGFVELDDPPQRHPLVQGRLADGQSFVRHRAAAAAAAAPSPVAAAAIAILPGYHRNDGRPKLDSVRAALLFTGPG